ADPHPGARGALGMGVDGELGPDRWRLRSDRPDRPEPRARGARAGRRRPRRVTNPVRAIGVDVGGTFTDLALWDDERGALAVFKLPSVPHDPAVGILDGLRTLVAREGVAPETLTFVAHGTTVATNALLEGKGARTGVVTTRGFRYLLEIARQKRPHLYDLQADKPALLVPRVL